MHSQELEELSILALAILIFFSKNVMGEKKAHAKNEEELIWTMVRVTLVSLVVCCVYRKLRVKLWNKNDWRKTWFQMSQPLFIAHFS